MMRLYRYRLSWAQITFWILLMLLVAWGVVYFAVPLLALIVSLCFIWGLLDELRVFPYSTVAIGISKEKIALHRRDGKEKKIITEVTEVKTWGGLARRVEIRGLSPEGKKTIIKVVRRELTKEQLEDFKGYLQQLFPSAN